MAEQRSSADPLKNTVPPHGATRWGLRIQLMLALGLQSILLIAVIAVTLLGIGGTNRIAHQAIEVDQLQSRLADDVAIQTLLCRHHEKDIFINLGDVQKRTAALAEWKASCGQLQQTIEAFQAVVTTPADRAQVEQWREEIISYRGSVLQIEQAIISGAITSPQDAANALLISIEGIGTIVDRTILIARQKADAMQAADAELTQSSTATIQLTLGIGILAITIALGWSLFFPTRIMRPVKALHGAALSLAGGNLETRVPIKRSDELGVLADSFNHMAETIQQRSSQLAQAVQVAEAAQRAANDANRLKTEFLTNMSHELRTPLNAIINFAGFILDGDCGPLSEKQAHLQKRIVLNSEHLLGLINDILDLAKIEAGQLEIRYEQTSLNILLNSVMATVTGLLRKKPLAVQLDMPPDLPHIWVDKQRIRQVLLNLLANAVKFTQEGSITIRVYSLTPASLIISVQDTGVGIPPESLGLVFQEFQQADNTLEEAPQGTGLGLPISKRLIEMHGGSLTVESTVGVGSTFTITLPIQPPAPVEPAPAPPAPALAPAESPIPCPTPLVAVIDDDPDTHTILRHILEDAGYQVQLILDSQVALAALRECPPALIILDIEMPHINGWTLLHQIQLDPLLVRIPVLVYTILDVQPTQLGVLTSVRGILQKPIRGDDLVPMIQALIAQSGATILIVDDCADNRTVFCSILEQQGYSVQAVADGTQALQAMQSQPTAVILDLMMPGMDGFAVLDQKANDAAIAGIPVIVVTAKDVTPAEADWLRERTHQILQKPVVIDTFLSTVQGLIQPTLAPGD